MKVSMDGLRIGLSNSYQALFEFIQDGVIDELDKHQQRDMAELMNQLRQDIGILNCVHDDEDPKDFNDMSERNEKLESFCDDYFSL